VRKAPKDAVGSLPHLIRREVLQRQVEPADETRMDARDGRVAFLAAGDRDDLRLRMPEEDLDRLEGGVSSGAEDCDLHHDGLRVQDVDDGFIGWPQVRTLPRREVG
jgi:hypothetical protein